MLRTLYFSTARDANIFRASRRHYFSKQQQQRRLRSTTAAPTNTIPSYIWISASGMVGLSFLTYQAFLNAAPLTNRRRWIVTSPAWEEQMGHEEYQKLLKTYRNDILSDQHRAAVTVRRVGHRIAGAARQFAREHLSSSSQQQQQQPTFTVVRSDMANAFVLPGNHIFVMTGLFRYVRTEDDLAAVLGHEMAHTVARHAGERVSGAVVSALLGRLLFWLDPSGLLFSVLAPANALLRDLPHSRTQEREADQIGVHLAAQACYDPRAAKRVFQRMQEDDQNKSPPEFLSTHPTHSTRVASFEEWIPPTLQRYERDECREIRERMDLARRAAAWEANRREGAKNVKEVDTLS